MCVCVCVCVLLQVDEVERDGGGGRRLEVELRKESEVPLECVLEVVRRPPLTCSHTCLASLIKVRWLV